MTHTLSVDLPSDTEILVTRRFDAPRALVWRAFTEPALLQRWMLGPPPYTMPVCEMDVREGGRFRWGWTNGEDSGTFGFSGVFSKVVVHERLEHNELYEPPSGAGAASDMGGETRVVVSFRDAGAGGTEVTTHIRYDTKEGRDAALATGMTDGMEMSYRNLDAQAASYA